MPCWEGCDPWESNDPLPVATSKRWNTNGAHQLIPRHPLPSRASAILGLDLAPDRTHQWRLDNEPLNDCSSSRQGLSVEYSDGSLFDLALAGGNLIRDHGFPPVFRNLRKVKMRSMNPQLDYVAMRKRMRPSQIPRRRNVMINGATDIYRGRYPRYPRTRGFPYRQSGDETCRFMAGKRRGGAIAGDLFVCTSFLSQYWLGK